MAVLIVVCALLAVWVYGKEDKNSTVPDLPSPPPALEIRIEHWVARLPPGPARLPDVPMDLSRVIRRATEFLEDERLDKEKCVPARKLQLGWKRCIGNYLVAATNRHGDIKMIEVYGGKSTHPPGYRVTCERERACDGGVNPPFSITSPPDWSAVAVRTAVFGSGPDGTDAAVYVPYSSRLNTPRLRLAGLEYLRDIVLGAFYVLRSNDVMSQFIPDHRITDFGTPDHIISLILTEQMWSDTSFAQGSELDRLEMLNRALATLGLNRGGSYRYSKSRAGATGIGQIVRRPYQAIREQYPAAQLPKDDVEGRGDHHIAVKAMIAHTDAEWWAIEQEESHLALLLKNDWQRRLVLAAGYNANIATVDRAIHKCGETWRETTCTILPTETRLYLVKYEWIYRMLFDPAFRSRIEAEVWPAFFKQATD